MQVFKKRKRPEYILKFDRMIEHRTWNASLDYDPKLFKETNEELQYRLKLLKEFKEN